MQTDKTETDRHFTQTLRDKHEAYLDIGVIQAHRQTDRDRNLTADISHTYVHNRDDEHEIYCYRHKRNPTFLPSLAKIGLTLKL